MPPKLQVEKPIVKFKNKHGSGTRNGRGYSLKELSQTGLKDAHIALLHGIPIDKLRRTSYPENIEKLRYAVNKINEPKKGLKEKPSAGKDAAKPKVVKKRTIRRKLLRKE